MFESILDAGFVSSLIPVMILMAVAGVCGLIASIVYLKTEPMYEKSVAVSLIALPVVVTAVLSAVNGSLGTGIAILGVFALTRFRSRRATFKEITFILYDMTIGVVAASGYIFFTFFVTVFVALIFVALKLLNFGGTGNLHKSIRIEVPETIDYNDLFEEVLKRYTDRYELVEVRTTNLGSMYELRYDVQLKADVREKDLLDEIRIRNGNLRVSIARRDLEIVI